MKFIYCLWQIFGTVLKDFYMYDLGIFFMCNICQRQDGRGEVIYWVFFVILIWMNFVSFLAELIWLWLTALCQVKTVNVTFFLLPLEDRLPILKCWELACCNWHMWIFLCHLFTMESNFSRCFIIKCCKISIKASERMEIQVVFFFLWTWCLLFKALETLKPSFC